MQVTNVVAKRCHGVRWLFDFLSLYTLFFLNFFVQLV